MGLQQNLREEERLMGLALLLLLLQVTAGVLLSASQHQVLLSVAWHCHT
jgi:hypothetical protein